MITFEKEISWGTWELDTDAEKMIETTKTKIVSFKELDKYDKSQHKLHFIIGSIPNNLIQKEESINIEPEFIHDLTLKFINSQLIIDDKFTETDKKELLQNSESLFDLGGYLLSEKITPFFLKFRKISS